MKVTVFMPVYNSEKYLNQAIESILNQTYTDFEFLIINDGSTDKSDDIIKKYLYDKRIRYVQNDGNKGLPYTRNRGLELCKGEYLALMDSDDIAINTRLEEQVKFLDANKDVDVIGADYYHFENNRLARRVSIYGTERIKIHLMFQSCLCNPVSMMRIDFIRNNNIKYREECFVGQDYAFWVDCSQKGKIENISLPLLKYRFGHENITKKSMQLVSEKRKEVLSSIRSRALINNGFLLSDEEMNILNNTLYDGNNFVDIRQILSFKEVLDNMLLFNTNKNIFNTKDFKYILQEIWADVIINSNISKINKIKKYIFSRYYIFNKRDIRKLIRLVKLVLNK